MSYGEKWEPFQCDHPDCLRIAVERFYRTSPSGFDHLCEKHLSETTGDNQ